MATNTNSKTDFYQEITNQIIESLEAGVKPWQCPWDITSESGIPSNASTGKPYNGMNIMLLWMSAGLNRFSSSRWLTFKQAVAMGGKVRKGEKGTRIFFYSVVKKKEAVDDNDTYAMLKNYVVFNADQVDGIELTQQSFDETNVVEPQVRADDFISSTGATIHHGGQKAFYRPSTDEIVMPPQGRFDSTGDYYATLLHELSHWSGAKSRLDRKKGKAFGDEDYAFEELIAELSSAFLYAALGIEGVVQHDSYIASWLKALRNDKRYVFKAATQAKNAFEYLDKITSSQHLLKVA
ncbi:DNA primase TraC [Vibrio nigripulchritudo FTn2]|uniref:ArdC family protein n=1 Tax=Vibrio nigripulchritudo TaxID=28173 RepID=UPI0003B17C9F|nr:zincin-like metallopeptidase domain-containing protein [Vibrio nigripulchritudo]CCN41402.1 DNA primase TraC [Vibrio nigripulchritudo FTn2]